MGEENWQHSSQQRRSRMNILWLVCLIALINLQDLTEAKKKKPKPKKPKGKGKSKIKVCLADTIDTTKFERFTVTKKAKGKVVPVAGQPCWWDLSEEPICAKCKPNGKACGYPMHEWCQDKKSKIGCKGIPHNKETLSTKGYPCYWDPKKLDCAWCADKKVQCKDSQAAQSCGSFCMSESSPQCDGVASSCLNIPVCGFGGSCDRKTGKCKCGKGFSGNGFQCFNSSSGDPAPNPNGNVLVTIGTDSKYFVYPDGSNMFPSSP